MTGGNLGLISPLVIRFRSQLESHGYRHIKNAHEGITCIFTYIRTELMTIWIDSNTKWSHWSTELRKSLRMWFGEVCSCCCWSLLPELAWDILATTYKDFFSPLYILMINDLSVLSDYYSNNIAVPFYEENWYQVSHSIPQNFDIIPFSLSLENHTKCRLIISIITTWAKGNGNCTATRPHYPTLWLRAALSHLWEATHHKQSDDLQPR